ncbi:MAG TPA: DUF2381 family protein [Archangium sp.]|nr:DUF2381 family protein [Archangium sp.]
MPTLSPAALSLVVLLAGATVAAQPPTLPGEKTDEPRVVVLSAGGQKELPELRMRPDLLLVLLFGAPLKLAGVELEERERFSRVSVLEDALMLVPSHALGVGRKLRLRVRFVEGTLPLSADFLLVVDPTRPEHQVNVNLLPPQPDACWQQAEAERISARQCQAELERMRKVPDGLAGMLVSGQLDDKGITARRLHRTADFTQRPGEPLKIRRATSYRARGVVAVELWVLNHSTRPWTAAGVVLGGDGDARLKVLRVWPLEPLLPGPEQQRVVVVAEASETQARGLFTLSFWQDGKPPSVSLEGLVFP